MTIKEIKNLLNKLDNVKEPAYSYEHTHMVLNTQIYLNILLELKKLNGEKPEEEKI